MANFYWVGGSGSWTDSAHWSSTSGGAGGLGFPGPADDVFFDSGSGSPLVVTVSVGAGANSINVVAGGTLPTISGTGGSLVVSSAVRGSFASWASTVPLNFLGTGDQFLEGAGFGGMQITVASGILHLSSSVNIAAGTLTIGSGAAFLADGFNFSTNNSGTLSVSAGGYAELSSSAGSIGTLSVSGTVSMGPGNKFIRLAFIVNSGATVYFGALMTFTGSNFSVSSGATVDPGTGTIDFNASGTFGGGGKSYPLVTFSLASSGNTITGSNSFAGLSFASFPGTGFNPITLDADQQVGVLTLPNGNSAIARTQFRSSVLGTKRTVLVSGSVSGAVSDVDFRDIRFSGVTISGTRLGDCGNNSGITFAPAKTVYYASSTGANWNTAVWALTDGGAPSAQNFPLPQDTAIINDTMLAAGSTVTFTPGYNVGTIDMSARTAAMTVSITAAQSIHGSWKNGSGVTLTGTTALNFYGRGSYVIDAAGKTFGNSIAIYAFSGTYQLAGALTTTSTATLNNGTLDLNGYTLTATTFTSTSNLLRSLAFGSAGTIALTSTGTVWSVSATNMTASGNRVVTLTNNTATARTITAGSPDEASAASFSVTAGTGTMSVSGSMRSLNLTGYAGAFTFAASTFYGSLTLSSGMSVATGAALTFAASSGNYAITTFGKSLGSTSMTFNGGSSGAATWTLNGDFNSTGGISVLSGNFVSGGYAITAANLNAPTSASPRSISLGSSTVTLTGSVNFSGDTSLLTFNSGTSSITTSSTAPFIIGGGKAFYDVAFTGVNWTSQCGWASVASVRNLTLPARTTSGVNGFIITGNTVVSGTLTVASGASASMRTMLYSSSSGSAVTLTCNAVAALTDVDLQDITFAGNCVAGGNLTGTRLGNCKGNSGVTFDAGKTVYWNLAANGNWSATAWAPSAGGTPATSNFPLAQDTAIIGNTAPASNSTITIDASYNIGAIDFTGRTSLVTLATGTTSPSIYGNFTLASGAAISGTGQITFAGRLANQAINLAGKSLSHGVYINSPGGVVSLAAAFSTSSFLSFTAGTFTTNNYSLTSSSIDSTSSNDRTINLGSSTVTLTSSGLNFGNVSVGLTLNAGTSQISHSSTSNTFQGGGLTFYNVSFTSTSQTSLQINGANTFNNLTIAGRIITGINVVSIFYNQTINGTLTLSAGTNATMRTFLQSTTIGTPRTLIVNSFAAGSADIDFRDITIAGVAAPIIGTRFGDCKGNSGIGFISGFTRYWNGLAGGNWSSAGWAATPTGTPNVNNFPLAQDTAVFSSDATSLPSGATMTVNANYNIGTIDMSARTTNTMTLATGSTSSAVYGNWINGTGVTLSGTGTLTFAGRANQTITSAGKAFTQLLTTYTPGGSVTLQDALTMNAGTFGVAAGTFNANNYNVTMTGYVNASGTAARAINIGSGTWTIASVTGWSTGSQTTPASGLTITGSGTLNFTYLSGGIKFYGGNIQTYPTINNGSPNSLVISGSNKFANITSTGKGPIQFDAGTTNEFVNFNLNGSFGYPISVSSSSATLPATIKKGTPWVVGANSIDGGGNTGLSFTSGGGLDYLSFSYINAILSNLAGGAFFAFF